MLTSSLLLAALGGPLLPLQADFPAAPAPRAATVHAPSVDQRRGRLPREDGIEPIALRTGDKVGLKADFYPPRGTERRAPAVLLVHDAGADRTTVTDLAEGLQRASFAVLALDLRGHGQSVAEDLDWTGMDEEARKTLWAFATRDVDAAARWLSQREGIHSTNLTVIGVGAGGALAVRHAARNENVRCVGVVGLSEQTFGFDLASDLRDVEGLPILVAAAREQVEDAVALIDSINGNDYVTVARMRSTLQDLLGDKRLKREVVDWVEAQAMPKRGGRG